MKNFQIIFNVKMEALIKELIPILFELKRSFLSGGICVQIFTLFQTFLTLLEKDIARKRVMLMTELNYLASLNMIGQKI